MSIINLQNMPETSPEFQPDENGSFLNMVENSRTLENQDADFSPQPENKVERTNFTEDQEKVQILADYADMLAKTDLHSNDAEQMANVKSLHAMQEAMFDLDPATAEKMKGDFDEKLDKTAGDVSVEVVE